MNSKNTAANIFLKNPGKKYLSGAFFFIHLFINSLI